MPRGRPDFYDPFVQTGEPSLPTTVVELPPLPGLLIERPGVYFHVETVCYALRYFADQIRGERPEGSEVLRAVADALAEVQQPPVEDPQPPVPPPSPPPPLTEERFPEPEPANPEVARIEVFPDSDGKWHARPVDATGVILDVTDGDFDRENEIANAARRWPGLEIHELQDESLDSFWEEQHHAYGFNGRRRPSPRRLFGG